MSESTIVSTTTLRQVVPMTEPMNDADAKQHNLRIKVKRKRRTIRGGCRETEQVTAESEKQLRTRIPQPIFNSLDELGTVLSKILRGRLELSLDDGTVNGVADVVYNNLRDGVCRDDDLERTVVVVIVEISEMEMLPCNHVFEGIREGVRRWKTCRLCQKQITVE